MGNVNNRYAVGADVGGSHISAAVVDLVSGKISGDPVEVPVDSAGNAEAILSAFAECILRAVELSGEDVGNVAMAFPGPFDYVNGISTVSGVAKYERIFGLDIASSLAVRLGVNNFRFVNDASAFALGECSGGAAKGFGKAMALTLGTGVGSAFVADGELVEKDADVPENGWVYNLPFEDGIADEAFSTRWVCRRYREITGETVQGAKELASRCPADRNARRLFEEYGERLAEFAAPVAKRFSAEILVLGGNISRAYIHFGRALENGLKVAGCDITVRTSALMDKAALVGAAHLFAKR